MNNVKDVITWINECASIQNFTLRDVMKWLNMLECSVVTQKIGAPHRVAWYFEKVTVKMHLQLPIASVRVHPYPTVQPALYL